MRIYSQQATYFPSNAFEYNTAARVVPHMMKAYLLGNICFSIKDTSWVLVIVLIFMLNTDSTFRVVF